jgi:hypothetical protein
MEDRSQRGDDGAKRWFDRLDRSAGELNAFLLVLAIGLAVLDATYFFTFKAVDALPSVNRIGMDPSVATRPVANPNPPLAVLTPTKPGAAATGW